MLNTLKKRWILTGWLLLCVMGLSAQEEISVRVQVNRMPDGHYPTKIYQFNSTPGLVVITLTNHTQATRTVYLSGKLTGDNGVLVATPKNFQPPSNIELGPLATKTLNAIEASYLFDANSLVYISGSTSIKSSVFGEQGLPEGTYQLCIRAVDAATRAPLSDEDPIGCSNIFTVMTLEPPMILNPYNEQAIMPTAVQTIPIRWTTPPGAPPSTEYLLRIVEVFGQRNPYDAIHSASTPFFETTVKGSPLFLYTIQQPRLQEGRTYAMIVVASDPFGSGTFRNKGQSEVVQFTYGAGSAPGNEGPVQPPANGPSLEYANHALKGHLSWAFKKTETGTYTLSSGNDQISVFKAPVLAGVTTGQKNANTTFAAVEASPYLASTVSRSAFSMQAAVTPLISMNALAAVNADPTLSNHQSANSKSITAVVNTHIADLLLPTGILSGSGSSLTGCTYETVAVDTSTDRYNLSGVPVTLQAVMASGANRNILLATGQTDADGNFSLQFLDPAYGSGTGAVGLKLSVGGADFENPSVSVPLSILNNPSADLGDHVLLAKTLRIFPKVVFDSLASNANGYGWHIYRDVQELQDRPWLANEGQVGAAKRSPVLIEGRQMVEIAADSITPYSTAKSNSRLSIPISVLDAKGAGRIFFGGGLYIRLVPSSSDFYTRNSIVNVVNAPLPSNKILQARVEYTLTHQPAHLSGTVTFPLGEQGKVPVQGSIVRARYKKADRDGGNDPNDIFRLAATENKTLLGAGAGGNAAPATAPSWTNTKVNDPGITTLQAIVWTGQELGLGGPVMVQENRNISSIVNGNSSSNGKYSVSAVLDPVKVLQTVNTTPDDSRDITTTADELGNYYIMLPSLKKGAIVSVEVTSTPSDFRNFLIEAQGYNNSKADLTLDKGASGNVDFTIKGDVADVVGRVVDDQGKALANARIDFKGSTLGATGPDGLFEFRIYPGNHSLTLEKEGYVVKQVTINVPQMTNKSGGDGGYASKWLQLTTVAKQTATLARISQSETVQASVSRGNAFSAAMFGIAAAVSATPAAGGPAPAAGNPPPASGNPGPGSVTSLYNGSLALAFGVATSSPGSPYEVPREFALDVKDIGYLNKIVGKARFRVVEDGSNNPIAGVRMTVFDSTNVTDDKGEWYYEGFGGTATLTVIPPPGTQYIPVQKIMTLSETGKEELMVITLQKGIAISGVVSSGGKPLPGARILLDDQDFTGIVTDASGHYTFYTTAGSHKVGARKQGYVGSDRPPAGIMENKTLDFDLTGGSGKNYSTLLGFAIELDETLPAGAGQEKWSGNFVRLLPVDKNAFTLPADMRIPFSNLVVSFDGAGNPLPAGNVVRTDLTELPFKLFGYLPVKLVGEDLVSFSRGADGKGQLNGKVRIAFGAIQGYRGWSMNDNTNIALAAAGATAAGKITLFSSGGEQPAAASYALVAESGAQAAGQLYGFGVGLNSGTADPDGIQFAGSIATPASGPIKSISIPINKLSMNRALSVSAVLLNQDALPSLEIATWKIAIQGLIFNEDGFKIGGNLSLAIPKSSVSLISFSDLSIAKTGLFGGKFNIPDGGINILSMAFLNADRSTLTFGRVGSSDVYRLAGKASLKIDVTILQAPLKAPSFEILTNGNFSVQAPTDYSTKVGPFGFALTNLIINANDNTPSIVLQGKFNADFSFLKFEVGEISVRPAGGGPVFSVSKVSVKLDVPVVTASVLLSFDNDGFEGEGGLSIPATPINGTVGFKYYKHADGSMELGAKFFANIPPVPIGGLVTLEGIGGGFDYKSGGPNGGFTVDVRGKISLLGSGTLVALNPVGITVESAGVLRGYGDMVVGTYLKKGHADVIFNGPDLTFTVNINLTMSPMEGLVEETVQGALVISAKKDDEFAFLGCATQFKLLGLIDNHGEMAIAVHLKNPKTRDDLVAHYFEYAPQDYMQDRFSGVYLNVSSHIGVSRDDAIGFDFFIASAKAWFEYGYDASLLLNFEENAYRISFGGGFDLGAEACVAKIACVGVSASMCIHVEGGRNNTLGWNFMATATGDASLSFGLGFGDCDAGCNEVVSFWDGCIGGAFKICGAASLDLRFSERNGVTFNFRGGGDVTPCF